MQVSQLTETLNIALMTLARQTNEKKIIIAIQMNKTAKCVDKLPQYKLH